MVREEARELRDQGHSVFVLTSTPFSGLKSLLPKAKIEDGIAVLRYFPLNIFWYRHDWKFSKVIRLLWHIFDTFNIHSYFVTLRVLRELKPEQVRTHNLKGVGLTTALALRKRVRSHWTHFIHDVQLFEPSGLLYKKSTLGAGFYTAMCRWLFGSPACVEAPSFWVINEHKQRGFFKESTFSVVKWYPDPQPLLESDKKKNPKFLFVGQLAEHKGIIFLADVLADVPAGYTLDVVGGGPLEQTVRKRFSGNPWVHFHGRVTQQEVRGLLADADYLLVPSLAAENCPTVIVDALNLDVPVISSTVGGIPEMINHGVNGLLVEPADQKAWKGILEELLTNV